MSQKIVAGEDFVVDRGLHIQTRCAKDVITDEMIAGRAFAANMSTGDRIVCQCVTHDRSVVLYQREYLIYSRQSKPAVDESNERAPRTFDKIDYRVMPLGEWLATPAAREIEVDAKAEAKADKPKKAA